MKTKYLIFDLDDTLIYEIDFLKSAFRSIARKLDASDSITLYEKMWLDYRNKEDVFGNLINKYSNVTKDSLLNDYRNHYPTISLIEGVNEVLFWTKQLNYKLGVITDGRSVTQRNKLQATQIESLFDKIVISEEFGSTKPNEGNYSFFHEEKIDSYYYIGDNPKKDFITPNRLGWTSVCLLDKGCNVHPQIFDYGSEFLPKVKINSLLELKEIIQ